MIILSNLMNVSACIFELIAVFTPSRKLNKNVSFGLNNADPSHKEIVEVKLQSQNDILIALNH